MSEEDLGGELRYAAKCNDESLIIKILSKNPSTEHINSTGDSEWTPLHWAAWNGNESVCRLLLQHGALVHNPEIGGDSPLLMAAVNGHEKVCSYLLQYGSLVDSGDSYNMTSLHKAAHNGYDNVVAMLIQHGGLVDSGDAFNITPLHYSAAYGHENTCLVLLRHGADLRRMDAERKTPLSAAVDYGLDQSYYPRCAAIMVLEWVRHQPGGDTLTGKQLIDACRTELDLHIHHLPQQFRLRMMEWVGILECSKMAYGMFQACPLPFQEMVVAWLTTVSEEWEREVDGSRVRLSALVGDLLVELVERVVATIATKNMISMFEDDERKGKTVR